MMHDWKRSAVACVTVMAVVFTCRADEAAEQATYDQRQTGDLNVHVQVQDIGILALLDESLLSGGYGVREHTVTQTPAPQHTPLPSSSN